MATAKARIRRARPLDVSNLCRLLAEGNQETNSALGEPDEGRLTALVLDLVRNGYVSVAEISGRLVAILAFSAYQPGYTTQWILDCEWFYLKPSLRQTSIGLAMLRRAQEFADKYGAVMRVGVCPEHAEFGEWLIELGYRPTHQMFVRSPEKNEDGRRETDEDAEPESVVRSGGPDSGGAGGDAEREAV